MKKLLRLLPLLLIGACVPACVIGTRTAGDEANIYGDGGKKIRGPRVNLGNALGFSLFSVDTGLKSSFEEPAVVVGGSVLSKTGLAELAADVQSGRSETNATKRVGYGLRDLATDVSTNAAPVVKAGGEAGGNLLHNAVTGGK